MSKSKHLGRHALDALVFLAWIGLLGCLSFFTFLERHSPTSPNVATGQLAPMNSHGYVFYVRTWEQLLFNLGFAGLLALAFGCVLVRRKLYGEEGLQPKSELLRLVPFLLFGAALAYMFWPMPR
jgi:hypothetical protein